ncbi:MAG: translation elongation factor Ts, partial [Spirochaetales bacterium]|nr:translation elongation factor Ts [Spirochaetales bacterium]
MSINANDIKTLREKTGAGMMDCKKALTEASGDAVAAEKLLKEWGLAGVEKRAGRATNEGRVFLKETAAKIAMIEIACETDFVARNDDFIAAGQKVADVAFDGDIAASNELLEGMVKDIASVIKENITLRRVALVKAREGEWLHSYVHGEGKIGVVVTAKADKAEAWKNEAVTGFVHDVALHIAAFRPSFLDQSQVSAEYVAEQKGIFEKQIEGDEKMKGKPANVVEGIVKGKVQKLMADICLMDQGFVKDEKQKVSKVMADVAKAA